MRRLIFVSVLIALALPLARGTSRLGASDVQPVTPRGNFSLAQARAFTGFPLYYAGQKLNGIPLTAVLRRNGRNDRANFVSFLYGSCVPIGETGCAPPAEVQVWPACLRNLSLYERLPAAPTPEPALVRGATAAYFEDGQRLELQTRTSTVVVFANSRQLVDQVAAALLGVNVQEAAEGPLSPPVPGAVEGRLSCS